MKSLALLGLVGACGFSPTYETAQPDARVGVTQTDGPGGGSGAQNPVAGPCHATDPSVRLCLDFEDVQLDPTVLDSMHLHDGASVALTVASRSTQQAAKFTSTTSSSVHVAESPDLDIADDVTWELWINFAADHQTTWPIDNNGQYALGIADNAAFCYANGFYADSGHILDTNEWHHLACVYSDNTLRVFVDGRLAACHWTAGSIANVNTHGTDFGISFDGALDDIHIFASALTDMAIATLAGVTYQPGLPSSCSESLGGDPPL